MHLACSCNNVSKELIQYLIESGVDIKGTDKNKRNVKKIKKKKLKKKKIEKKKNFFLLKCLYFACQYSTNLDAFKFLLDNFTGEIQAKDIFNQSLLHSVCINDRTNIEMLKIVLDKGHQINGVENNNKTPLFFLCEKKKIEYDQVKLLLGQKNFFFFFFFFTFFLNRS